jgi:arylsulfatase A-like enzyme
LNGAFNSFKMLAVNPKTVRACAAFLLISSFCFFAGCQKKSVSEKVFYRLIDLLTLENILASPLLGKDSASLKETVYPINSVPIIDLGIGENPLGLKRKHTIGATESNILFSPPKSEYSFIVRLPEDGVLDFGIGIVRDQNSEIAREAVPDEERGVEFSILLEMGGRKKPVFQQNLRLPARRESRALNFSLNKVSLPPRAEKARLSFKTAGAEGAFAFWYNPILYSRSAKKPNIILVSIDTLRADHLGVYGYERNTSPNMDALAVQSAVFLNTYASSPWTLPSHVSLLTSLSGLNHQVYYREDKIDPSLPTLADLLRSNGYCCSAITGGAFLNPTFGFSKGFDSYEIRGAELKDKNLAEQCFKGVSQWLDAHADENFFLFIHTYQTHSPYESPAPYNTIFLGENPKRLGFDVLTDLGGPRGVFKKLPEADRQNIIGLYDGEVRYTDEKLIKPLIERLRQLGVYDRTMLIVTSDHGEQFYDHGSWNHGNYLYGDALRVPLIIKFPDSRFRGQKISAIVRLIDVLPTILEELGIDQDEKMFDGRSLIPILKGRKKESRTFLADVADTAERSPTSRIPMKIAVNSGDSKLVLNREYRKEYLESLPEPPPPNPPIELYNLRDDPGEKKNIADQQTDIVRRLTAQVKSLYQNAQKRQPVKAGMTKELENELRALGYIR